MNNFFATNNMTLPPEGPRVIPVNLDMAVETEIEVDLTVLIDSGYISYVSGVWIDNSANTQELALIVGGSNQRIIVPASAQMSMPIFAVNPPVMTFSQAATGDLVKVFFVNFPVFPFSSASGSGGGGGNVVITGSIPLNIAGPAISDYSLDLAGGSETLVAAGNAAGFFSVVNPAGNSAISVNLAGGDASVDGISIPAGGSFTLDNGCSNAITIAGTAADHVSCFAGV